MPASTAGFQFAYIAEAPFDDRLLFITLFTVLNFTVITCTIIVCTVRCSAAIR